MVDVNEYISAGYFLSRHTDRHDCTGIDRRRVTLASEHSQGSWFPDAWTISWVRGGKRPGMRESFLSPLGR